MASFTVFAVMDRMHTAKERNSWIWWMIEQRYASQGCKNVWQTIQYEYSYDCKTAKMNRHGRKDEIKGEEIRGNLWAGLDKQASRPCCMCKQWGCSRGQAASARTGRWGIFTRPQTRLYYSAAVRGLKRDRSAPRVSATTAHTAGRPQRGSLICMPMNTQQTHTFLRDEAQTFDLEICYKVIKSLQNLLCWIIALWNTPFIQTISISVAGVWPAVMVQFNSISPQRLLWIKKVPFPWMFVQKILWPRGHQLKQYTEEICQSL